MVYTLRKIMEEHPDWLDYPITICEPEGDLIYVGDHNESGGVRIDQDFGEFSEDGDYIEGTGTKVLVFWS